MKNKLKFKMQKNNPFRGDFLSKNFQQKFEQQKKINEKEGEKEKLSRSQRSFNKNNHVHYYSKSSNQNNININKETDISKKLSFNDTNDDEELDHPRPLMSDIEIEEEELFILKNKFIKKIANKKNFKNSKNAKNDLNLKFIPKSTEIPKIKVLPPQPGEYKTDFKKKRIEHKNDNNINNEKIPFKNGYKSETISKKQINNLKSQLKNKMNYIISNNDIYNHNTEKKIKPKSQQIIKPNKPKPRLNNSNKNIYENNSSHNSNCLNNRNDSNQKIIQINIEINNNPYPIRNENKDYINIQNNTNNNSNNNPFNNKNYLNKNLTKQNSQKKIIYNNQKQQVHSVYLSKSKIKEKKEKELLAKKKIQEDYDNNYSQTKMIQTEPNLNLDISKIIQQNSKIKTLIKRKPINITNINNLLSKDVECHLLSERELNINKEDISEKENINYTQNNILNYSKMKSSEIKPPILEKKNNSFINKFDKQENYTKYKTKTFERGGKFNNIQTTYVVISKKKLKGIPKANASPKIIDCNKYKPINPIPSANCLNYVKLYKDGQIPQYYSTDLRFQRMTFNEPKKAGINKSQNHLPVKGCENYNTIDSNNNNNIDTNYKKYIDSSNGRNYDIYIEQNKRNSNYLINKTINNPQNTIPIYDNDYNYDFFYNNYDNINQIHNNHYISYNNNYNNF